MTVPQPSPEHRTAAARSDGHPAATGDAVDPWAPPPSAASEPEVAARGVRGWGREIREAAAVAVGVTLVTGLALGLLWLWLAPRVPLISNGEAVLLLNSEGEQAIAADSIFLLLGLGIGAVTGVVVFLLRRGGGVLLAIGLAVGGVLGSLLAWRTGVVFGPPQDIVAHARDVGAGEPFDGPLELGAYGVLAGLPFAAVGLHLLCTAVWGPRDPLPRPAEPPRWGPAPGAGDAEGGAGSR